MGKEKAAAIELLEAKKIPFELIPHKATFTAVDEASTLHMAAADVLKAVVLDTGMGHVVVVTPASRRLDMRLVREALGDRQAHLAGENEIERDFPAFELGSMPPLPSLTKVPVFVDPEVMQRTVVTFAVDHVESVVLRTEDLFGGEYVTVTPLVRHFADVPAK